MDAVLVAGIARDWNEELTGARVDKAWSPDPHRIDLGLRARGHDARVTFFLRPGAARCHPAPDTPANPASPSGFCMFLRRHLVGSRVLAVEPVATDRTLVWRLGAENEVGMREERTLRFEGFGPRPNLLLIDGQGRVMDAFRRVSAVGEGGRVILPGLHYEEPSQGTKVDPLVLGPDGLCALVAEAAGADRLADLLVRRVRAFAPVWAREVLAWAGLGPDSAGRDAASHGPALRDAFERFLPLLQGETPAPCVAYGPDKAALGAFPLAPRQWGAGLDLEPFGRIADAVAAYHVRLERESRLEQRRAALLKNLEKRRSRLGAKLSRQDQEWREASADLALRHTGELILANLHAIVSGAASADLDDWTLAPGDDGGPVRVHVALDPDKSPSENAERAFARYRKARRRHDALRGEIARGQEELRYIDSVEDALRRADDVEVLSALASEVEGAGVLGPPPGRAVAPPLPAPAPKRGKARRRAAPGTGTPAFAPLAYRTANGYLCLVGRTGPENDRLSLRLADADDPWFHVARGAGAHVVLRCADGPQGAPDAADLEAAAMLAAYHSAQRSGSHVEVDLCRAGRLRKAPGARPGLLLYDRQASYSVTPDLRRVEGMARAAGRPGAAPSAP